MTGRVKAISNNWYEQLKAPLYGAINEINCSSDVGSSDSCRSKFFARSVSRFKSFSLIEFAFAFFFKCSSDRNVLPPGQKAECRKELLLNHCKISLQSSMRLQNRCR